MNLMECILERENKFLKEVKELSEKGAPIYIYGAGYGGQQVAYRLSQEGIECAGMVVDAKYWNGESNVMCLEKVLAEAEEKINLIIAYRGFQGKEQILCCEQIDSIVDWDCWAGNFEVDNTYMTYEWVNENFEKLQEVFQSLCDEKSRETLAAFINQKISMDYKYLKRTKSDYQYFEDDIINLEEHEVFIDCGAYDGDSAIAFIDALKRRDIELYDEIISFEPDVENYKKLCEKNLKNHTCISKGVSDTMGNIYFSGQGTSTRLVDRSEDGSMETELDTIDHVLQGRRVTMIKMDIEGFELSALRGGQNTIMKWNPKLAICIYHKKEDLWEITNYIHQLVPEYKLYMRNYEDTSTEVILYAVL